MPQISREKFRELLAAGESLRGSSLVRIDLSDLDLARVDLAEANLRMANLARSDLREAQLSECSLSGASLDNGVLVGASLVSASLIGASLRGTDLSRADLSGADLTGADLQGANLAGAFLVGTFLNEADLPGANLTGAYVRMAQLSGSNMSGAQLDGIDLSNTDLSGARFSDASMVGANLAGANLGACLLTNCDLRGANLTGTDLSGSNLTGARLHGVTVESTRMVDAWAEWVDVSPDRSHGDRVPLEEVFRDILNLPVAILMVEGPVTDEVWAVLTAHICDFRSGNPAHSGLRLKALHQGVGISALYLEGDCEESLAAYLSEFADLMGKGAVELRERLDSIDTGEVPGTAQLESILTDPTARMAGTASDESLLFADEPLSLGLIATIRAETLQNTSFWSAEKAVAILTSNRSVWLEATSTQSLTLRPPVSALPGIELIRGRFISARRSDNRAVGSTAGVADD